MCIGGCRGSLRESQQLVAALGGYPFFVGGFHRDGEATFGGRDDAGMAGIGLGVESSSQPFQLGADAFPDRGVVFPHAGGENEQIDASQ